MTIRAKTFVKLFFTLMPCLLVMYMSWVYGCFSSPQYSLWIHNSYQAKKAMARPIQGRKWLVVGGSSVLFGVRASDLHSRWGVPVLNMGTHAGLMTDYLLWRIKKLLNPGDSVLLLMEYHNLTWDGEYSQERTFYSMTYDREFFKTLPLWEQAFMVLHIKPIDMLKSLKEQWTFQGLEKENRDTYHTKNLNSCGDDTSNTSRVEAKLAFARPYHFETFRETKALRLIQEFAVWCKERNIRLIISYENCMDFPEYHVAPRREYFLQLHDSLQKKQFVVVGDPFQFLYSPALFYDSMNHLNAEGAALRTKQLMEMIAARGGP